MNHIDLCNVGDKRMKKIMHVDLFSGIGGFSLAAERVWGKGNVEHIFCEINKYAQAVLRKNFGKDVVIVKNIHWFLDENDVKSSLCKQTKKESQILKICNSPTKKDEINSLKEPAEDAGQLDLFQGVSLSGRIDLVGSIVRGSAESNQCEEQKHIS